MIILFFSIGLLIAGILMFKSGSYKYEFWDFLCTFLGGILTFIILLLFAIIPMQYKGDVEKLKAFKSTIETSRLPEMSSIERAALTQKIAEWNEWIAETKYYNGTILGDWIPDEAANQELIK